MFFFILKKNKNINVMIIDAVCLHRCPTHTTCFIIGVQQYKKNETAIPNMQDVSGQNHCHCLTKDLILHPFSSFALLWPSWWHTLSYGRLVEYLYRQEKDTRSVCVAYFY
jgi:hypothetical protein